MLSMYIRNDQDDVFQESCFSTWYEIEQNSLLGKWGTRIGCSQIMAVYEISKIWFLGERVSPEAITRMAGVPLTGHLFWQMPHPTHCFRFT